MPITPLIFGRGLGRGDGALAIEPSAARDIRNWFLESTRAELRPGMQPTGWPSVGWGTDVVAALSTAYRKDLLLVVYDRPTREVRLYRVNPVGPTVQNVGTLGTLSASAPLKPPIYWLAEHSTYVFCAHDEAFSFRLATQVYTPDPIDSNPGTLAVLSQDLNGDGTPADVQFAGVCSWGAYMLGWGYGEETSAANKNQPAVLRVSSPGDVLDWPPGSFAQIGALNDPIRGVASGGPDARPCIFKATEYHALAGTSPANFEPLVLDPYNGLAANRALVGAEGRVFFWSGVGPRVADGTSPSVDLEQPLDLALALPSGLPNSYDLTRMWAVYHEDARVVEFGLPDAAAGAALTLAFYLSLRPSPVAWGYGSHPLALLCAAPVALDKTVLPAVNGYASGTTFTDVGLSPGGVGRDLRIAWTNNAALGDETIEVFVRPAGGTWSVELTVPVSGATQNVTVSGYDPLAGYEVALRYRRSDLVKAGYESSDPGAWTGATVAGAKASVTASCDTPVLTAVTFGEYSGTQSFLRSTWTLGDLYVDVKLEKQVNGGAWQLVAILDGLATPRSYEYGPTSGEAGATIGFRVTPVNGATSGTASNVLSHVVGLTTVVTLVDVLQNNDTATQQVDLVVVLSLDPAEYPTCRLVDVEFRPTAGGGWTVVGPYNLANITRNGMLDLSVVGPGMVAGTGYDVRVRGRSQYLTYAGPYSATLTITPLNTKRIPPGSWQTHSSPTFPNWDTVPAARSMRIALAQLGVDPDLVRVYLRAVSEFGAQSTTYFVGPFTVNNLVATLQAVDAGQRYLFAVRYVDPQQRSAYNGYLFASFGFFSVPLP